MFIKDLVVECGVSFKKNVDQLIFIALKVTGSTNSILTATITDGKDFCTLWVYGALKSCIKEGYCHKLSGTVELRVSCGLIATTKATNIGLCPRDRITYANPEICSKALTQHNLPVTPLETLWNLYCELKEVSTTMKYEDGKVRKRVSFIARVHSIHERAFKPILVLELRQVDTVSVYCKVWSHFIARDLIKKCGNCLQKNNDHPLTGFSLLLSDICVEYDPNFNNILEVQVNNSQEIQLLSDEREIWWLCRTVDDNREPVMTKGQIKDVFESTTSRNNDDYMLRVHNLVEDYIFYCRIRKDMLSYLFRMVFTENENAVDEEILTIHELITRNKQVGGLVCLYCLCSDRLCKVEVLEG